MKKTSVWSLCCVLLDNFSNMVKRRLMEALFLLNGNEMEYYECSSER